MMTHQETAAAYFQAWIDRDETVLERVMARDVAYSESYGPQYRGLDQIRRWFSDWNRRGSVCRWEITRFIEQGDALAVEWFFSCVYDGEAGSFDGVSLIDFDEDGRIAVLKEFQSRAEHCFPYGREEA